MKYKYNNLLIILLGTCHLSGCISGGGGSYNQSFSKSVYYTVPVKQTTVDPFVGGNENSPFIGDTFITDLDGDGASDDIVIAGREIQLETAGNWNNSRLSVHSFENGNQYIGTFKNGKRNGQGTFTYPDGDKFVGEWKDDLPYRFGTYIYSSGKIEKCFWKNRLRLIKIYL